MTELHENSFLQFSKIKTKQGYFHKIKISHNSKRCIYYNPIVCTSQRAVNDPPSHLPRHDAVHCLQCMWMYCYPHLLTATILTPLYLMCIIGSKNMLLVRFYLLCYGYESTFCWLTKQWSILDVCIVTQITNLKYNGDQKTVFVTACFSIVSSLRASSSFGGDRKTSHALCTQGDTREALARSRVLSWITLARHSKWGNFSQAKLLHGQVLQYIHEISIIEESLNWKCLQMKVTNKTMSTCS